MLSTVTREGWGAASNIENDAIARLFSGFESLHDRVAALQVVEQGLNRHSRPPEHGCVLNLAGLYGSRGVLLDPLCKRGAADAMQSLARYVNTRTGLTRRDAVWQVLALGDQPPLFEHDKPSEPAAHLPRPTLDETVYADYGSTGLSLNAHPMALIRKELTRLRVQQARVLKHARHGQWLRVAGLVLVRQRPSTALGVIFCTLEDETGTANLIIRPTIYSRFRKEATAAVALITEGRVERQGEVAHLQTARIEDVSHALDQLRSVSRDFH